MFLAVLGHDLRSPVNAIPLSARLIATLGDGTPVSEPTARLIRSGERMKQLLDDLLDYHRTAPDMNIAVRPTLLDLAAACREEIEVQQAALPDCRIELVGDGATWSRTPRGMAIVSAEGTSMGLGLFIMRQVTQAHGKTSFTVVLPRGPHPAT